MKCLILAGGFATRLYPLTLNRAKALLEYRGKPVISHIIDRIPRDIDILVSTNKKFEVDFLNWQKTLNRPVDICIEDAMTDEQKKGAIGAVDFWIKNKGIAGDLMVLAGDNYFELDLSDFIRHFNRKYAAVAVHDVGDKNKACEIGRRCQIGLAIIEKDKVVRFDEKPEEATSSLIATGIYLFPPRVFPLLSKYCAEGQRDNLGSFITYLLEVDEVQAYPFDALWIDIGDEIKKGTVTV
jgi:glucose-1-phosphate thymidylyltransferase